MPKRVAFLVASISVLLASCVSMERTSDEPDTDRVIFFVLDMHLFNEEAVVSDTLRVRTSLSLMNGGPMYIRHSVRLVRYQVWCNGKNAWPGADVIQQTDSSVGYWKLRAGQPFGGAPRGVAASRDVFDLPVNQLKIPVGWSGSCTLRASTRFSICESSDPAVLSESDYACSTWAGQNARPLEFEVGASN